MAAVLFKVFALALRTAAKPLGYEFQSWALQHPIFRKNAVKFAQKLHSVEVWISRRAEGKEGKAFVGSMTDDKALELASKVVSEGFVFSVGAAVVSWEYVRSKRNEMEKKAVEEQRLREEAIVAEKERERLQLENMRQNEVIQGLIDRVAGLEDKVHQFHEICVEKQNSWFKSKKST